MGKTGVSEREAKECGFDYGTATVQSISHSPYYTCRPLPADGQDSLRQKDQGHPRRPQIMGERGRHAHKYLRLRGGPEDDYGGARYARYGLFPPPSPTSGTSFRCGKRGRMSRVGRGARRNPGTGACAHETRRRPATAKLEIREAFWRLYTAKPISKISVKDICALAGYNRGTFYRYYSDVYEVLESIENEILRVAVFPSASPRSRAAPGRWTSPGL